MIEIIILVIIAFFAGKLYERSNIGGQLKDYKYHIKVDGKEKRYVMDCIKTEIWDDGDAVYKYIMLKEVA